MKNKYIIIILSILFLILSILIISDLINNFDNLFYNLITYNSNEFMNNLFKGITFLGSTAFIIFLCVLFLILFIILKRKNIGIIISVVLINSTIINNVLKIIFRRGRPDVLALVVEDTYSYPSGHTMASVSMYGILIYIVLKSKMNKVLKGILVSILSIIPILVGISRVYLGAHYMSDVIGSFIVSIILLLCTIYVIDKNDWI